MTFAVTATTLPDRLFESLLTAILDGRYAPGDRLPSQRALAAEFGVNMASLRAAIDRLAQLRLIEVRHGEPMRVADWRSAGGLELLAHAAGSEPALLISLFEARAILLREAATLAAARAGGRQRDSLVGLAAAFAGTSSEEQRQALDLEFMAAVLDASGNLVFTLILNSMRAAYMARLEDFRAIVSLPGELAPLYRDVAEEIGAGDAERAAAAMEALTGAQLQRMLGGRR